LWDIGSQKKRKNTANTNQFPKEKPNHSKKRNPSVPNHSDYVFLLLASVCLGKFYTLVTFIFRPKKYLTVKISSCHSGVWQDLQPNYKFVKLDVSKAVATPHTSEFPLPH
jgi:hypothetical protein